MHFWWSLCTLYLLACRVGVTVSDSGLCYCVCMKSFEHQLTPLYVDSSFCVCFRHFSMITMTSIPSTVSYKWCTKIWTLQKVKAHWLLRLTKKSGELTLTHSALCLLLETFFSFFLYSMKKQKKHKKHLLKVWMKVSNGWIHKCQHYFKQENMLPIVSHHPCSRKSHFQTCLPTQFGRILYT